jgi:type IV secretory pathway VirB10-like protein
VLEAGFLVLLALVVGIADLDPLLIILVMAIGWLLVSLIEYLAWRQTQGVALRRVEPAGAAVMDEAVVEDMAPPPPPPPPPAPPAASAPPVEEETIVAPAPEEPAAEEPEPAAEPEPAPAPVEEAASDAEQKTGFIAPVERRRIGHLLDPLQPRPRRRWILFGPYDRREAPAEDDREEEQ